MAIYFCSQKNRIAEFVRQGGVKLLNQMTEGYTQNHKVYDNITNLMEILDI